jgi:hypothetical protein
VSDGVNTIFWLKEKSDVDADSKLKKVLSVITVAADAKTENPKK